MGKNVVDDQTSLNDDARETPLIRPRSYPAIILRPSHLYQRERSLRWAIRREWITRIVIQRTISLQKQKFAMDT
jgi:hypothetical protein